MGISCGATLIKYLLFLFNLLWLVLGGVVLWLGFKISIWSGDLQSVLETNMKAGAITVLVAGFVIFFIAFLGCCGAIKENSCMLSSYAGIILILVIMQCVGAYYAFKYKTDIKAELEKGIKKEFEKFRNDKDVAKVVQEIQKTFECCGIENKDDFRGEPPASCCAQDYPPDNPQKTCSLSDVQYNTGCVNAIQDKVSGYLGGLAAVAIALVAIQLIIMLSACCLSKEVGNY